MKHHRQNTATQTGQVTRLIVIPQRSTFSCLEGGAVAWARLYRSRTPLHFSSQRPNTWLSSSAPRTRSGRFLSLQQLG